MKGELILCITGVVQIIAKDGVMKDLILGGYGLFLLYLLFSSYVDQMIEDTVIVHSSSY